MVKKNIVLSLPGDFTASFYENLREKIMSHSKDISPVGNIKLLDETLSQLISESQKSLWIMAPFQTNINESLLIKIEESIKDGTDVRILTRYCSDEERCFDKGIIKRCVKHFDHSPESNGSGSLHAKMLIRDNEEVYFGSGELMETSLNKNLEIGLLTDDSEIVLLLCNIFDTAWELSE